MRVSEPQQYIMLGRVYSPALSFKAFGLLEGVILVVELDDVRKRAHAGRAFLQPRKIFVQTNLQTHSIFSISKIKGITHP